MNECSGVIAQKHNDITDIVGQQGTKGRTLWYNTTDGLVYRYDTFYHNIDLPTKGNPSNIPKKLTAA